MTAPAFQYMFRDHIGEAEDRADHPCRHYSQSGFFRRTGFVQRLPVVSLYNEKISPSYKHCHTKQDPMSSVLLSLLTQTVTFVVRALNRFELHQMLSVVNSSQPLLNSADYLSENACCLHRRVWT
jgi:hypothetical protein